MTQPDTHTDFRRPSVWSIAAPSIAMFMISTLAGVVLIRIAAGLGTPAVAAVTAGQRVNFIILALLMGMGAATTALVSRAWGAKNSDAAVDATRQSLKVGLTVCALLSITAISLAKPLAHFFQLEGESYQLAVSYVRLLSLFGVFQGVMMILSTACRAIGDAKTPLFVGILVNTISVVAAYGFAYGRWGMPDMGVNGVAIGWGIAYGVGTLCYLVLWLNNRLLLPFSYTGKPPQGNLNRFLTICLPATVEQLIMQTAMLMFIAFIAGYGTEAFSAYGVGMSLFAVTMVIGLGFSIAASALVGQSLGAGDSQGALDSTAFALKQSIIVLSATGLASALFANPLANAMVDDPKVAELTAQFVLALALVQPLLAVDFVLGGAMRGAGYTGFPLIAGIVAILGVRLPLAALISEYQWSVGWIFSVFIADQLVKVTLIVRRYRTHVWLRCPG